MTNQETAYTAIGQLVQRFKSLSASERKSMNENATRQGYILPLFRALGWNVDNVNEVSPEEKVSRGWVDFSFRIGGIPRYFLETKKASEDLQKRRQQAEAGKDDSRFALQKRIHELDSQIDTLVYQLYALTEEEIKIVES
jgi:hypothetical protein